MRRAPPDPIAFDRLGHPNHLRGAFLAVGHRLFDVQPQAEDPDGLRARLNRVAARHIDDLYELLIRRPGVPSDLRRIFEEQRRRFNEMGVGEAAHTAL